VPHIQAHPLPNNLLEWHFVLEGAKGTDFEGGIYHGKLVFPPNYPFKPPSISIFTPNGRFAINTKLCLSITDFHPESWNPMWSVGTILTGLMSFMYDSQPTTGSINTSKQEKQRLARESLGYNCRNATFRKLFPQWQEEHNKRAAAAAAAQAAEQQQQLAGQQIPSGRQPLQQQQQQWRAPGAAAAAGGQAGVAAGRDNKGGLLTVALVVIVLAIAAVPFFGNEGAGLSLSALGSRFS
jgi:ubiquitin-conjugating enzyme E2 J2